VPRKGEEKCRSRGGFVNPAHPPIPVFMNPNSPTCPHPPSSHPTHLSSLAIPRHSTFDTRTEHKHATGTNPSSIRLYPLTCGTCNLPPAFISGALEVPAHSAFIPYTEQAGRLLQCPLNTRALVPLTNHSSLAAISPPTGSPGSPLQTRCNPPNPPKKNICTPRFVNNIHPSTGSTSSYLPRSVDMHCVMCFGASRLVSPAISI
jgi:hypothetical protein